jgi:23S rRNA (uracil1939-C5)-methyltransferase
LFCGGASLVESGVLAMTRVRQGRGERRPIETREATVESMSHDGRGVVRIDGKATFVHGALPGERVRLRIARRHRNFDEAETAAVLEPSADRVEPACERFGVCGGCSLQHLDPRAQIASKQQVLLDALRHIGDLEPERVFAPVTGPSPWGYRRKARLGVKFVAKKAKALVGFRERNSSFVTDTDRCPVLHPRVGETLGALATLIGSLDIRDRVPQVEVAMGDEACVFVFRTLVPPSAADADRLRSFGGAHGVAVYVQEGGLDSIRPLDPPGVQLTYALPEFGVELEFRPGDFTQVNFDVNRLMVARAVELLRPQGCERVLDLFCGLGNFTLPIARRAAEVVGVEGEAGLVARARANALRNGIGNARFVTANLYAALDAEPWAHERFEAALLDPPRTGAIELLPLLPRLGVARLVYVSCYPGTLARDAAELVHRHGYRLAGAGAMDMFPHTAHVESIAVFERR